MATCKSCGTLILTKSGRRFCSDACRKRAYRRRKDADVGSPARRKRQLDALQGWTPGSTAAGHTGHPRTQEQDALEQDGLQVVRSTRDVLDLKRDVRSSRSAGSFSCRWCGAALNAANV